MSGIVTDSSGWRTVDDDAAEVARYLETATRLLAVVKRRSIDMLRLSNGASVLEHWMRSWPRCRGDLGRDR